MVARVDTFTNKEYLVVIVGVPVNFTQFAVLERTKGIELNKVEV